MGVLHELRFSITLDDLSSWKVEQCGFPISTGTQSVSALLDKDIIRSFLFVEKQTVAYFKWSTWQEGTKWSNRQKKTKHFEGLQDLQPVGYALNA